MPCDPHGGRPSGSIRRPCATPREDAASVELSAFRLHLDISGFCTVEDTPFEGAVPILMYGESEDFRKSDSPQNGPWFTKERVGPFHPGSSGVPKTSTGVSG